MLWRLPSPVRSLVLSALRRSRSTAASTPPVDPLRILFCGCDDFSIASLRALTAAKHIAPRLIESIHVVHRPPKPAGRGLKTLREVPIQQVAAHELRLDTHAIDTFTGWTPPVPVNLIIAVSFGLLVPPRILNLAQYGGLNVHPSLLPDLRGPAPIEHAILKGRLHTGVSIQTLHPAEFDRGTILAQTQSPGVEIQQHMTAAMLKTLLADAGAELLVQVLRERKFVPPLEDAGWYSTRQDSGRPVDHAGKLTKQHRFIDFAQHTMDQIFAIQRAMDDPWCRLSDGQRLILHELAELDEAHPQDVTEPGIWVHTNYSFPLFRSADGKVGVVLRSTYAGSKKGHGNEKMVRLFQALQPDGNRCLM